MTRTFAIIAWAATAVFTAELLGYLLHRLLHSGWIRVLSMNHMKHHLLLYGPLQKQRPSSEYLDATAGKIAIGNVGLEWIVPAGVLLVAFGGLFWLFGVSLGYQVLFFGIVLAWSFWVFSYLHDRMHIKGFWMERVAILKNWFRWAAQSSRYSSPGSQRQRTHGQELRHRFCLFRLAIRHHGVGSASV
jgi:hypothetical protein